MKAGTTALYRQLLEHPQIGMSRSKEPNFFVEQKNWQLGQDWYESQFDSTRAVTGEVSPAYTKHDIFPGVPKRISRYQPATKLIFIARDPVERFISHYRHAVVLGHTDVKPAELLGSRNGQHMLETSRYAAQLDRYLEYFPQDQIYVADFAELTNHPQQAINKILLFLDVLPMTVRPNVTRNDIETIAAIPRSLQQVWQSSSLKKLDWLMSNRSKDIVKRLLSARRVKIPTVPQNLPDLAAKELEEDAQKFRALTKLDFADWTV